MSEYVSYLFYSGIAIVFFMALRNIIQHWREDEDDYYPDYEEK